MSPSWLTTIIASGAASSSPRYRASICTRCFSASLCTLMSRIAAVTRAPSALSKGLSMSSIGNSLPSLCRPVSSSPMPIRCASTSAADRVPSAISHSAKPSGTMFVTFCPRSSSRRYPNCLSACPFRRMTSPSWFTTTIASGAASSSRAMMEYVLILVIAALCHTYRIHNTTRRDRWKDSESTQICPRQLWGALLAPRRRRAAPDQRLRL